MKIQNPTKLDIFFKGGGIIKFPVQNLKQIDVEPIDDDGGGSDSKTIEETINSYIDFAYDGGFIIDYNDNSVIENPHVYADKYMCLYYDPIKFTYSKFDLIEDLNTFIASVDRTMQYIFKCYCVYEDVPFGLDLNNYTPVVENDYIIYNIDLENDAPDIYLGGTFFEIVHGVAGHKYQITEFTINNKKYYNIVDNTL